MKWINKSVGTNNMINVYFNPSRSSRPEVFCKNGVLRNFTKLTGKHLRQSLFFNKVVGLRPATLLKRRLWHRCFPVNFEKFRRTPFFIEHLWRLLRSLKISNSLILISIRTVLVILPICYVYISIVFTIYFGTCVSAE